MAYINDYQIEVKAHIMRMLPGIPSWLPCITAVLSMDSAYYGSNSSHPLKHNKDQGCSWASIKSVEKKYISVGFLYISENQVSQWKPE